MKALTERQRWVYCYVEAEGERNPDRWVPIREIASALAADPGFGGEPYRIVEDPKNHNPCPSVWADVEAINASGEAEKLILYSDHRLKMPKDYAEARECYLGGMEKRGKKILWRLGNANRKLSRDGQGVLLPDEGSKPFVEAYLRGESGLGEDGDEDR